MYQGRLPKNNYFPDCYRQYRRDHKHYTGATELSKRAPTLDSCAALCAALRCGSFSYIRPSSGADYYPNNSNNNNGLNCALSLVLGRDLRPSVDLVRDPGWDVFDFDGVDAEGCRFRDFGKAGNDAPAVEGISGGDESHFITVTSFI